MISSISLDTSSYKFDGENVEYNKIRMIRALWVDHGPKLTIKLLLWAIGMIVASGILTIKPHYSPLDSWVKHNKKYLHITTRIEVKRLPKDANIVQESTSKGSSTKEAHKEYAHYRVRTSTNQITSERMIGIRIGGGSYV